MFECLRPSCSADSRWMLRFQLLCMIPTGHAHHGGEGGAPPRPSKRYMCTLVSTQTFHPTDFLFAFTQQGTRIVAEKVVHHPTIIAGHAEGRRWTLDADGDVRSKFWGRSIELIPVGASLPLQQLRWLCHGRVTECRWRRALRGGIAVWPSSEGSSSEGPPANRSSVPSTHQPLSMQKAVSARQAAVAPWRIKMLPVRGLSLCCVWLCGCRHHPAEDRRWGGVHLGKGEHSVQQASDEHKPERCDSNARIMADCCASPHSRCAAGRCSASWPHA